MLKKPPFQSALSTSSTAANNASSRALVSNKVVKPEDEVKKLSRYVLTLEVVLETTAKLCGTSMLQKLLCRMIECLASPYETVVQTAHAALFEIAPNRDVAKLFMGKLDYITDRLIARLQFVDVSPEVLTVFSAILSVEGDISDLLSHLIQRIYELLDTRDTFSLHILRMFPRVVVKIPSNAEQVIHRSIHFVLSTVLFEQTICETALLADRSFVRNRVRDLLPLFSELIKSNLILLQSNPDHRQAYEMLNALLSIVDLSLEGSDVVFDCLELEVFCTLLLFFDSKTKAEHTQKS